MAQTNGNTSVNLDDIVNKNNMGDKKSHSESSLQHFVDDEEAQSPHVIKDPGVCTFLNYYFLCIYDVVQFGTGGSLKIYSLLRKI